jgi:hypothetical protein
MIVALLVTNAPINLIKQFPMALLYVGYESLNLRGLQILKRSEALLGNLEMLQQRFPDTLII